MSDLDSVDPELRDVLSVMPVFDFSIEVLAAVRAQMAELRKMMEPANNDVLLAEHFANGSLGHPDVKVVVYRPVDAGEQILPAYVAIHGGGYILGSTDLNDPWCRRVTVDARCVVASVGYRLAPEAPFPAAIEDCYAALRWLHENAAELGVDAARIAIGGESAGAGLAAALAILARDRGETNVVFQSLMYPMLDDRTGSTRKAAPLTGAFVWTAQNNAFGWRCLLGTASGHDGVSPYAAAARAADLTHLPPAQIIVGALDLFLGENIHYAKRLIADGIATELHVYPGVHHGVLLSPNARITKVINRQRINALSRAFGRNMPADDSLLDSIAASANFD